MSEARWAGGKVVLVIATCSLAWVVGATLFFSSGGVNAAGLVPTLGCLLALWGALRADPQVMWLGTGVVLFSTVAFVFSIGYVLIPAACALIVGSLLLGRAGRSEEDFGRT